LAGIAGLQIAMKNNISISGMGQFVCPGDVPICYGGSCGFEIETMAAIIENDVLLALVFQATQNKTFS
jgi:hypothetical protein